MPDADTNREQLIAENTVLRQRIAALEAAAADHTQIEEALQASERRSRHLMEHSLGLLCIHDLDGTLLEINTAAARALGYQPQDGVGKSLREFIAPSVQYQFDAYLECIRQHPTDSGLLRVVTRTGENRVWKYQNVRMEEPGQPPYVLGHAQDITDLLRAQQTLQVSEERFRSLVEGSIQGIIIHRDFKPLFVNHAYARIHGYDTADDILKMETILPLAAPPEQARWCQYEDARLRGEDVPTDYEFQAVRKDGSWIWLDNKVRIVTWDGAPAIQSTAFDITERKQGEAVLRDMYEVLEQRVAERTASLQRAEAETRVLFTHAGVGMFACDSAGQFIKVNPAFCAFIGYGEAELVHGMTFWDLTHPDFQEITRQTNAQTVAGACPITYEKQFLRRDGTAVWGRVNGTWIYDDDGNPIRGVGVVEGITERKQAEEALRASEDLNRRIVEAVPGGIVQVTQAGRFVRVNEEARHFLECPSDDLSEHFVTDFAQQTIWEDGSPCAVEDYPVSKCLATHQPQPVATIGVRRLDGTVAWAVFTAVPLADPATGEATGAVVTFLDITQRKQVEQERQRLEAQLHQMQKMDSIGTLAGGIAHEFNNMLAGMLGFTQLATTEVAPTSRVYQYLQEVSTAGNRAKDLVQQILAFSHPSAHDRESMSLSLVIQEALKFIWASLPTTIEIRQRIVPETGMVLADATQLHQVLMNLCTNAEYTMRETGGTLEVGVATVEIEAAFAALHPALQPGPHVRVTVGDTGRGMSPEVVERIFDPFFTTKGIGEGTGMGLAIVHGIVTSHGGVMTVESALGKGTTFTIYLPQIADAAGNNLTPDLKDLPQGKGQVLFVDDEEMLCHLAQGWLALLGYNVMVHTSSLDALHAFQGEPHRFDLVITDQTMPHMTGEALARELRHIRPDIPIILCTGFSHTIDALKARAMGIDAFCMKPLDIDHLAVIIQQVLGKDTARER